MNRFRKIFALIVLAVMVMSCQDKLDIDSSDEVPTAKLYETVDGAYAAMNGIYRALATPCWTTSNLEQASGLISSQLAGDLMGEDMVQRELGNGWYYYHYTYQIREYQIYDSWTPYEIWNMWYTVIAQMNEVIAYTPAAQGEVEKKNSLIGQAYALRGYAYFSLIRWFQRTYVGHEDAPGVPIYTVPTESNVKGKARGTVRQVYEQINHDLDSALLYLENAEPQLHKSHIDKYVAWGFRSRVALVQEDWQLAADAAAKALQKEGLELMSEAELMAGFNTLSNREWMWGSEMSSTQTTAYASLWAHMDARLPMHAETSRKIASKWLYEMIPLQDIRRDWFVNPADVTDEQEATAAPGPNVRYNQQKFQVANTSSLAGDYLYMRAAEMYLNQAEALCRLGEYSRARQLMIDVIGYKNSIYESRLRNIPDGNVQTLLSTESNSVQNLLDEILLQRRIELWGEGFRMFDVIRLKSGFNRNYSETNHPYPLKLRPDSWKFVLLIPQKEIDNNDAITADDQNPLE